MAKLEGMKCPNPKCSKGILHYAYGSPETVFYKCDTCGEEFQTQNRHIQSGPMDPHTMEFK